LLIKDVRAFEIDPRRGLSKVPDGHAYLNRRDRQPAGPLERYAAYRGKRGAMDASWRGVGCVLEAEDGTTGFGMTVTAGPVVPIINDHLREQLVGQPLMATEKLYDLMYRVTAAYGGGGVAAGAISAVDVAAWDAKGKVLDRPVYELLGGPWRDKVPCYATGFDVEWFLELGFQAVKLPNPYGPPEGDEGLRLTEEMVAEARELLGPDRELMLDCWMAMDVDYMVRLAERLRPYGLVWIEDYLLPDDMAGFREVRKRLPGQPLATGEHWYQPRPFLAAVEERLVDYFQPDVLWCGGVSSMIRICHIAEAAGIAVAPHGGMNYAYGQHVAVALPAVTWGERSGGVTPRGVPLADNNLLPGSAVIADGQLTPSDAPGFGLEITDAWLEAVSV
jgi:L-rhamnonate dehydratase